MAAVDPTCCPLCGKGNMCLEAARQAGQAGDRQRCWCMDESIPEQAISAVGDDALNTACICNDCAKRYTVKHHKPD